MLITTINKTAVLSNQLGDILKGMLTLYQRVDSVLTIYVPSPMNMTYPRYSGVDLLQTSLIGKSKQSYPQSVSIIVSRLRTRT